MIKTILTMLSTMAMSSIMSSAIFSPLQEVHHLLANKRRFFYAIGFYAAGFVFLMTGIISGSIEATLQYEAQGFIFWSAMLTLAMAFAGGGLLLALVGNLVTPNFLPEKPKEQPSAGIDWSELIEGAIKVFAEMKPSEPQSRREPEHAAPVHTPRPAPTRAEERSFEMTH